MPKDIDEEYDKYVEDPRIPCQYGIKCYQKNPAHLLKYKHPPRGDHQKNKKETRNRAAERKRKADVAFDNPKTDSDLSEVEHVDKKVPESKGFVLESSSSSEKESEKMNCETDDSEVSQRNAQVHSRDEHSPSPENAVEKLDSESMKKNIETENSTTTDNRERILKLFLTEMPQDFYQFYDFCQEHSKTNPALAFKIVDLKLVGPFDVLSGGLSENNVKDNYLRHWRYYYDPPEFQTVLKGNDKDGLHFGYWRDDPQKRPVFVAKNSANRSCKIVPVAENLFGALDSYLEERTKVANVFDKTTISRLHQKLKTFAKERNITLEKHTSEMKKRERCVVARTIHGAGIVVPYDPKTLVGYRKMSVSEADLQKILQKIGETSNPQERMSIMSELQEVIRWATIAADECDFGTSLELGHNLFSSGVPQVEDMALQMLSIAYVHLERSDFLKIAQVHLKDRKKGSSLSII